MALWVIVALLLVALFNLFQPSGSSRTGTSQVAYSDFLNEVQAGHVRDVTIQGRTLTGQLSDGRQALARIIGTDPAASEKQLAKQLGGESGKRISKLILEERNQEAVSGLRRFIGQRKAEIGRAHV